MMRPGKIAFMLLVFLCVLAYGASVFRLGDGRVLSVSVDLANPQTIVAPCEVSIVGDMGERGLRIPPKVGSGWKGKVGGEATYRFYAPQEGRYHIWVNALWFDKCTNAVFAQVDSLDKAVLGNDPVYQQWHWVRGFAVTLSKGAHALTLSNHSDHISLQKIWFVNSSTAVPDDCSIIFSDVFYDGFDGCHIGNFASWEPVSGEWEVVRPEAGSCYAENALVGRSQEEAIILYEGDDWSGYSYRVAVRFGVVSDSDAAAAILFGVLDRHKYFQLAFRTPDENGEVTWELSHHGDQATHLLATSHVAWCLDDWHEVEVVLDGQTVHVIIDGQNQGETAVDGQISGGIGLCVLGQSTAVFDDIHVRTVTDAGAPEVPKSWWRVDDGV